MLKAIKMTLLLGVFSTLFAYGATETEKNNTLENKTITTTNDGTTVNNKESVTTTKEENNKEPAKEEAKDDSQKSLLDKILDIFK